MSVLVSQPSQESSNFSAGSARSWQRSFEDALPVIRSQAQFAFRHLADQAAEEAIQEVTCDACMTFARLFQRGQVGALTPTTLARYAILRCRGGRECAQRRNGQDALSPFARRRKAIHVESLSPRDEQEGTWQEVLVEDRTTSPADLACIRIDYRSFLVSLDPRRRQIAETLASGETTFDAAWRFGISSSRISQLRQELKTAWDAFVGNVSGSARE